jgi:hypothetical protein
MGIIDGRGGVVSSAAPLWKRLAWMAAIWAVSVAALGVVSLALRFWLKAR